MTSRRRPQSSETKDDERGTADSSFLVDRPIAQLSAEEIRRGPTPAGQEPQPPLVITKMKEEGQTTGFFVKDARGERYLLKLDLVDFPELITGAEIVTSKLMYALGYYVPSYEIVEVAVDDLTISPMLGKDREELTALLHGRIRDGRVRASASRFLEGELLGPFRFRQFRHCPSLRALRLASAWLNNTDTKDHNTLMVWTGGRAIGYLIDFGTSLGAEARHGPKEPCQGWVYDVDLDVGLLEVLTLGWYHSGCDRREHAVSPALGLFSTRFDPRRWKPYAPNLAFARMTEDDARWMAGRIAALSRAQLEAAVVAGRYSNPEDAARLIEILEARQATIVEAYLR